MKFNPMMKSLAETDAYKDSMGQLILHNYMRDWTEWAFYCRNKDVKFSDEMVTEIKNQLHAYCDLRYSEEELMWMKTNMPWIKEDYITWLRLWHPRREEIFVNGVSLSGKVLSDPVQDVNGCGLVIETRGPWISVSPYEIAILAIVNETYFAFKYGCSSRNNEVKKATEEKIDGIVSGKYELGIWSDFGLRRRYSADMQDWIIQQFATRNVKGFIGTSNVYLAMKYNVRPVGTMAHELGMVLMTHDKFNPAYVNARIMDAWVNEYDTDLGIYLNDLLGQEVFLLDFNKRFAKGFDGLRHDSGDPYKWGDTMLKHYEFLGIDPSTKTLLFSDGLNFEKATNIYRYFKGKCKIAFGIGTSIQAPFSDALNIVCKVRKANDSPTCKLSNVKGKIMGESKEFIDYVQSRIEWRLKDK